MKRFIEIQLACAYCFGALSYRVGDLKLTGTRSNALAREGVIGDVTCPHCGSVFTIGVETKRKRQGSGYKRQEAKKREIHEQNVAEAVARNVEIAKRLLAQPGCTCAEAQREDSSRWYRFGYGNVTDSTKRAEQLAKYGHLFGSTASSYGIPRPPMHDHKCPCRNTDEERAIRGTVDE